MFLCEFPPQNYILVLISVKYAKPQGLWAQRYAQQMYSLHFFALKCLARVENANLLHCYN